MKMRTSDKVIIAAFLFVVVFLGASIVAVVFSKELTELRCEATK